MKVFKSRPNIALLLLIIITIGFFVGSQVSTQRILETSIQEQEILLTENSDLKSELETTNIQLINVTEDYNILRENIDRFDTLYDEQSSSLDETQSNLENTQSDLQSARNRIENLQDEVTDLKGEKTTLQETIDTRDEQITQLNSQINDLDNQRDNLQDDIEDLCALADLPSASDSICDDY